MFLLVLLRLTADISSNKTRSKPQLKNDAKFSELKKILRIVQWNIFSASWTQLVFVKLADMKTASWTQKTSENKCVINA